MHRELPPLTYELFGQPQPLPAWLTSLTELGSQLAQDESDPVTVGLIVPTDLFLAPFCALGCVLGRLEMVKQDAQQAKDWGDFLLTLPGLTPVSYFRGGKLRHGWMAADRPGRKLELTFSRATKSSPDPPITIVSLTSVSDARRILAIRPLHISQEDFMLRRNRVRVSEELMFLERFLDGYPLPDFLATSRPDCLIFGNREQLLKQCTARFTFADREKAGGTLADVLRIRDNSSTWRTAILSDRRPLGRGRQQTEVPRVVIFTGSAAWFRFKGQFPHSHHVVITTHDQAGTGEVVSDLFSAAATRREGFTPAMTAIPCGMEVFAFRRFSSATQSRP